MGAPSLLGLELIRLAAADVGDGRVVRQLRQVVRRAVGTEAVQRDPGLGHPPCDLGPPLVDGGRLGEAELAPVIVVLPHPPTVAGGFAPNKPLIPANAGMSGVRSEGSTLPRE